jgi:hypothetical protein
MDSESLGNDAGGVGVIDQKFSEEGVVVPALAFRT